MLLICWKVSKAIGIIFKSILYHIILNYSNVFIEINIFKILTFCIWFLFSGIIFIKETKTWFFFRLMCNFIWFQWSLQLCCIVISLTLCNCIRGWRKRGWRVTLPYSKIIVVGASVAIACNKPTPIIIVWLCCVLSKGIIALFFSWTHVWWLHVIDWRYGPLVESIHCIFWCHTR